MQFYSMRSYCDNSPIYRTLISLHYHPLPFDVPITSVLMSLETLLQTIVGNRTRKLYYGIQDKNYSTTIRHLGLTVFFFFFFNDDIKMV